MKKISFVRHAHAESHFQQGDKARRLSRKGVQNAKHLGQILNLKDSKPSYLLCSPALRTQETVEHLVREMGLSLEEIIFEEALYLSYSLPAFLQRVSCIPNHHEHILIVGHNPWISEIGSALCSSFREVLPPGTCLTLGFEIDDWMMLSSDVGVLLDYYVADMI